MAKISPTDFAHRIGCDPSLVRMRIRAGKLAATKFGKVWMIDASQLRTFRKMKTGPKPRK